MLIYKRLIDLTVVLIFLPIILFLFIIVSIYLSITISTPIFLFKLVQEKKANPLGYTNLELWQIR